MSDVVKILIISASIIITCIIVAIGFAVAKTAKNLGSSANIQIAELDKDISESGIMAYHNTEVTGSEIVNLIKEKLGEYDSTSQAPIYIYVKTSTGQHTHINNEYMAETRNFASSAYYIKPTAKFMGEVIRNENGVIVGVNFTQK